MPNHPKTLVVVEGGWLEHGFFDRLKEVFGLNLDIYCLENNIYLLYKKIKKMGFNADLKDVLLEVHQTEEIRKLLSQDFAYTYLFFDFDPQHTEEYEKDTPIEIIVENNIKKVCEMAEYFVNETDPTVGKLYINYPMMESFKDCDSFQDLGYLTHAIKLDDIGNYKKLVGLKKMANKRVDGYTKEDFTMLIRQNVNKLTKICKVPDEPMDYEKYVCESNQTNILQREIEFVELLKEIAVLNTSVFFVLDYYGNKEGFYDDVIGAK